MAKICSEWNTFQCISNLFCAVWDWNRLTVGQGRADSTVLEARCRGSEVTGKWGWLTFQHDKLFSGVDLTLPRHRCGSRPPFLLTCPECSPQERSARFLVIARCETQHSGSSLTLILPGSSVAEYADLSTALDETHVWNCWRVFGVSMPVGLITTGGVTALTVPA